MGRKKEKMQEVLFFIFRERTSSFSLGSWKIRPSDSFVTRTRVVLLGEDNAWTTVLGSFFKLLEVGVSSYLFYTLFKCFVMFVLIEAVSGRLIGSKSWNRSVGIFETHLCSP